MYKDMALESMQAQERLQNKLYENPIFLAASGKQILYGNKENPQFNASTESHRAVASRRQGSMQVSDDDDDDDYTEKKLLRLKIS